MSSQELFKLYIHYPHSTVKKILQLTKFVTWMECVRPEIETICNEVIDALINDSSTTMSIIKFSDVVVERCKVYEDWDEHYEQETISEVIADFYYDCGLRQHWYCKDDINYEMRELIVNWMGYVLADQCNNNSACESWNFLVKSQNINLLGFVINRNVSIDGLHKIISVLEIKPESIVKKLIGASENSTIEKEQCVESVFENINGYAYALSSYLPIENYWPLINQLLKQNMYKEVIRLLLKFEYPITIYYLLETINSTQKVYMLIHTIKDIKSPTEEMRILTMILIYAWWRNLVEEVKRMSVVRDDKLCDISTYISNWEKGLSRKINHLLQDAVSILGEKIITKWVSGLSMIDQHNMSSEIRAINRCTLSIKRQHGKNISNIAADCDYDFLYLLYAASYRPNDKKYTQLLCNKILESIYMGKMGWHGAINKNIINEWTIIAKVLYENDANMWVKVLDNVKTVYEGYRTPNIEEQYKKVTIECYCIGIILLSIPFYNRMDQRLMLKKIIEHVLLQCYYCHRDYIVEHYYYAVLVTIELICDQHIPSIKKEFEKKIIKSDLPIALTLKVLAAANKDLDTYNKILLQKRLSSSWNIYKQILTQKKMNSEIQILEKIIKQKTN